MTMKVNELRGKNADQLNQELLGLRREQFNLRMQRGAGQLANPMRFSAVRKDIARIKTILTEKAQNEGPTKDMSKDMTETTVKTKVKTKANTKAKAKTKTETKVKTKGKGKSKGKTKAKAKAKIKAGSK